MKKIQIATLTALFASAVVCAADDHNAQYMYGAPTAEGAYNTNSEGTSNGRPWGSGYTNSYPATNGTTTYNGVFDGTNWAVKSDGFININGTVETGNFFWTDLGNTTASFKFTENNASFIVNSRFGTWTSKNSYRGITLDFSAASGVKGTVNLTGATWAHTNTTDVTTLILNGDSAPVDIRIGQGVTFNMNIDSAVKTAGITTRTLVNNLSGKQAGTLEAYDGGIISVADRLTVKGSGIVGHNDIKIGAGSKMEVGSLAFKESNATIEVAGQLIVTGALITNNTITFNLQEGADIQFNDGLAKDFIGNSTDVRFENFVADSVKIAYSDYAKSVVETMFSTYDGSKWVHNLTLSDSGVVTLYTSVPEPAEWAAIFGVFALALAVYRKRK